MELIWTTVPERQMPPGRAGVRTGILSATALMTGDAVLRELRRESSCSSSRGSARTTAAERRGKRTCAKRQIKLWLKIVFKKVASEHPSAFCAKETEDISLH
jgi:hypothetical protein